MGLRGVKPAAIKKRLKLLLSGKAGDGKTTAAISFSLPYLIDTERGAENDQYVKLLQASGGAYFFSNDLDDIIAEVSELLTTKHKFQTLVIDPLTCPYNDALDKEAKRLANRDDPAGTAFGRNKQVPDRKIKHLMSLLLRLDMNVIITSHAKAEWKSGAPTGTDTFDCYNKLDYLFDLWIHIQMRAGERVGIIKKTRCESFPLGEVFPFSYDEIANRYGRDILEKDATPEVVATPEQVARIVKLIETLGVKEAEYEKWLDKAGAENWAEMPTDAIAACIVFLEKKVAA